MRCIVCGGDHVPHPRVCDSDGMDREIARMGTRKWNAVTAMARRAWSKWDTCPGEKWDTEGL